MNNLEQALLINQAIDRQSQFAPTDSTFDSINKSRQTANEYRLLTAILQDQQQQRNKT